jgi:hypothetical protein
VGVVFSYAGIFWVVSARRWFTEPTAQDDPAQLAAVEDKISDIEAEPEEID